MLIQPTLQKLQTLKCFGMLKALEEQMTAVQSADLSFDDRLGLLVDREITERDNRRFQSRLKNAKLKQSACMEDIDYKHHRGLDKSQWIALSSSEWIQTHLNILITGPTGVGKTYLACALGHQACRTGYSTLYLRIPRLFEDLLLAKGTGRYAKMLASLAKIDLLILDDWGLSTLTEEQRRDFLEIIEDRTHCRSTLITGQVPTDHWHKIIGDPTLADAILDRLVHNAYKINLKGESLRKKRGTH